MSSSLPHTPAPEGEIPVGEPVLPKPEELLGFRLPLLASIRSTTSARRNERLFGLKNLEGRLLFVIGAYHVLSLKQAVRISGIEKAYASRTVAALVESGRVKKTVDELDRRAVRLTLTKAGRALYRSLLQDAVARDEDWLSVLTGDERVILLSCLERLAERARLLADRERSEEAGKGAAGRDRMSTACG